MSNLDHQQSRRSFLIRASLATLVATAVGFSIHVIYGEGVLQDYIQRAAQAGRLDSLVSEPLPLPIVAIAFVTALIPYAFKVLIYYWAGHLLPGRNPFLKGLSYGILLLGLDHSLIRMPVMNFVVGNPADVVLLMSAEAWSIALISGLIIAFIVPLRNSEHGSSNQ
ncbi:MAG: hypothetical protein AAF358_11445 [Pseudomonadota bacterium]